MVRYKVSKLLNSYGITPYRFAQAVKATGTRSESWAYRTARGEIKLTADGLALIVEVLRDLTHKEITVDDVVEIVDDENSDPDPLPPKDERHEQETLNVLYRETRLETGTTLIPYSAPASKETRFYQRRVVPRLSLLTLVSVLTLVVVSFLAGFYGKSFLNVLRQSQDQIVESGPIPTPVAIGPEGEVQGAEPKLRIEPVPGATHYVYSIFNLLSRQNVVYENSSEAFLITPKNALCPNAKYAWKAKAFRGAEESSFSSNMEFSIHSEDPETQEYAKQDTQPEIPAAVGPEGVITSLTPTLEIRPIISAVGYGFYLRDLTTDQVYDFEYQALTHKFEIPEGILSGGRRYRWNARAFNCAGFSLGYSDTLSFEVAVR